MPPFPAVPSRRTRNGPPTSSRPGLSPALGGALAVVVPAALALAFFALAPAPPARADSDWPVPPAEATRENPLKPEPANLAAGKAVWEARCASCHGLGGKGDGKASGFLPVKPSDLTTETAALERDGEMYWRITTGRIPMPGFEKKLTETERWQAVLFVRQLQLSSTSGPGTAPAAPEATPSATSTPAKKGKS